MGWAKVGIRAQREPIPEPRPNPRLRHPFPTCNNLAHTRSEGQRRCPTPFQSPPSSPQPSYSSAATPPPPPSPPRLQPQTSRIPNHPRHRLLPGLTPAEITTVLAMPIDPGKHILQNQHHHVRMGQNRRHQRLRSRPQLHHTRLLRKRTRPPPPHHHDTQHPASETTPTTSPLNSAHPSSSRRETPSSASPSATNPSLPPSSWKKSAPSA